MGSSSNWYAPRLPQQEAKSAVEMQTSILPQFFMFLAAESCRSRYICWNPIYNGKGLKEFQLCDSRRLHKKPQDDVTELFDLFDAIFGLERL